MVQIKKISKWNQSKLYTKRNGNQWEGSCSMDFSLCSYIPITLNNPLLYFLLTSNEPSDALLNSSFLNNIQEDEHSTLENGSDSEVTKVKIASSFNQFDSNVRPSASNFGSVVSKVSRYAVLSKPYSYVVSIQKGMHRSHCQKMFSSIDGTTLIYLLESMRPQGNVIAKNLYPWHHNNPFIKAKEDFSVLVMDFLVDYVKSMDSKNASLFMKYITGLDLFISSIHVDFNGVDNFD